MTEQSYLDLLTEVLENGHRKGDRTGTGTMSVFGPQLRFSLGYAFPALTTKKLFFKSVKAELAWFIQGYTDVHSLQSMGTSIWDEWADDEGDLGPVYGFQWRHFGAGYKGINADYQGEGVDQLANAIDLLENKPDSRRIIVSAWNPEQTPLMGLPPCHLLFQFYTHEVETPNLAVTREFHPQAEEPASRVLSCHLYQRSADLFLGVPFNIASYALLTHLVARQVNMLPGTFVHSFGDAHIYTNHVEQVREQLTRQPHNPPALKLDPELQSVFRFRPEQAELVDYEHHPAIRAPIAV